MALMNTAPWKPASTRSRSDAASACVGGTGAPEDFQWLGICQMVTGNEKEASELFRTGLKIEDIQVAELNEAFAAQSLPVVKDLGLMDRMDTTVNLNGGAIALGHPLGMSGARIALTVAHTLQKNGGKLGLATLCVGVGQGVSLALERVS